MRKILLPLIVLAFIASSCSYVYIPNAAHIPLISKKGEVQASVLTGTSNLDFQTAYGLTDQVSLMANGSFADRNRVTDSASIHKHTLVEAACGYYKKVGRSGILEVYGGGGYGSTFNYELDNNLSIWGQSSGKYAKFFVQPNIGAVSDIFDGGLSVRVCYVNYFEYHYFNDVWPASHNVFVEPVMTGKIGYKNVKFIMQIGFSVPVMLSSEDALTFDPFILNIGLNFKLNTIKDKSLVK